MGLTRLSTYIFIVGINKTVHNLIIVDSLCITLCFLYINGGFYKSFPAKSAKELLSVLVKVI